MNSFHDSHLVKGLDFLSDTDVKYLKWNISTSWLWRFTSFSVDFFNMKTFYGVHLCDLGEN